MCYLTLKGDEIVNEIMLNAFSSFFTGNDFNALSVNDDNIGDFLKSAHKHKISAVAIHSLLKNKNSLSSGVVSNLKSEQFRRITLQTRKTEAFLSVYSEMINSGLCPICVKGLILSSLYPVPDIRECSDEDLLVSQDEYERCEKILVDNGFILNSQGRNGYVKTYFNEKTGCMIDLHHTLFPDEKGIYNEFNLLFCDVFENKKCLTYNGMKIYSPSADKLMLYLIIHIFKHFVYSGVGIRQIADVSLLANSETFDWNELFLTLEKFNLSTFTSAILLIGNKFFNLDINNINSNFFDKNIDITDILDDILNGGIYGSSDADHIRSNNIIFEEYKKSTGFSRKKKFLPTYEMMKSKYKYLDRHPYLLPVSYVNKFFDYIKSDHNFSKTVDTAKIRKELMKKYGILK